MPSAVAGGPSVTRLTHSRCIGVSGSGSPSNVAKNICPTMNKHKGGNGGKVHNDTYSDNFADIARNEEADEGLHVGIYVAALFHSGDDGGEVVVRQNHVSSSFGHLRTGNAHRNACKVTVKNIYNQATMKCSKQDQ